MIQADQDHSQERRWFDKEAPAYVHICARMRIRAKLTAVSCSSSGSRTLRTNCTQSHTHENVFARPRAIGM